MGALRTFESPIALTILEGDEHEFILKLSYQFTPGYPDTHEEPGCSDSVEIIGIRLLKPDGTKEFDVPAWMQALIDADEALAASLIADAREQNASDADDAAERKAEAARDDRMMEAHR